MVSQRGIDCFCKSFVYFFLDLLVSFYLQRWLFLGVFWIHLPEILVDCLMMLIGQPFVMTMVQKEQGGSGLILLANNTTAATIHLIFTLERCFNVCRIYLVHTRLCLVLVVAFGNACFI